MRSNTIKITEQQIRIALKNVFVEDRRELLKAIVDKGDILVELENIADKLTAEINQPFQYSCLLSDKTLMWLKLNTSEQRKKKSLPDEGDYGDASYYFAIPLNEGIDDPLDFDKELAIKCGGKVMFMNVWASLIIPLYTYDIYYMTYDSNDAVLGFGPYTPKNDFERNIVRKAKMVFNSAGFNYLPKKIAEKSICNVFTDCNQAHETRIFDCLFTDIQYYTENRKRIMDVGAVDSTLRDVKIRWDEYYAKNKLIKKSILWTFPSGDVLHTISNHKGQIIKVSVLPKGSNHELSMDIEKRLSRMKQS